MARTFRRPRQAHPIAELNVTNLIDLGFTLLIIFMIATPSLINQEQTIPIRLPLESKGLQSKPEPGDRFVAVSVNAQGEYYIDNRAVTLEQLRSSLATFAAEAKPPVVRIRGDGDVPYQKIIQLVDELKRANLVRVTFDTRTE